METEAFETMQELQQALGIENFKITEIRKKDGVAVYRAARAGETFVLKTFEKESDRREIANYRILQSLNVPTLRVIASTDSALLMEDVSKSASLRLGLRQDMDDPAVAVPLARWYRQLHAQGRAYAAAHGAELYDEADVITAESLRGIAAKTDTRQNPLWALLDGYLPAVCAKIASAPRTLTYNDFYFTNLAVAKDLTTALMFDYNLLGKGYAYADLRNVTASLGKAAKDAFLREYGAFDEGEIAVDDVASALVTLHFACCRNAFPAWAAEERTKITSGELERAVRRLVL